MIRIVPKEPLALSLDEGKAAANAAYGRARDAQRAVMSRPVLIDLLWRPGPVSYGRLRGEIYEAQDQVKAATAVLSALEEARDALEATTRTAKEAKR